MTDLQLAWQATLAADKQRAASYCHSGTRQHRWFPVSGPLLGSDTATCLGCHRYAWAEQAIPALACWDWAADIAAYFSDSHPDYCGGCASVPA